jgi:hypothetical protein
MAHFAAGSGADRRPKARGRGSDLTGTEVRTLAQVDLTADAMECHLSLADELLSVHGSLRVAYSHIVSVSTDPVPTEWWRGFRVGTNLPGIKVAGTFFTPDGAIFCDFHRPDRCLTLELAHDHYRRVIVEVGPDQDPAQLAATIRSRTAAVSGA